MSWRSAKKEAQRWLDTLNLQTKALRGQRIDLNAQAASLRFEAKFRTMVIRAAKRILEERGVFAVIDEPKPLGRDPEDDGKR